MLDFSSSEAQVVEKTVEVTKPERKKPSKTAAANKDSKRKRTPTAFFLFMYDSKRSCSLSLLALIIRSNIIPHVLCMTHVFHSRADFRKEFKAAHPDNKNIATVRASLSCACHCWLLTLIE